jgi:sugar (pentulose or hexulose) kinase
MKDLLRLKEKMAKIERVRLCGGVASSTFWCQMFADILNKPIELTEVTELGSLGAAMCAGIGAGLYKDCRDAINRCVRIAKTYVPNKSKVPAYEEAFKKWNTAYEVLNREIY